MVTPELTRDLPAVNVKGLWQRHWNKKKINVGM